MEQRITMISLGVKDINISKNFYENGLGWKCTENSNKKVVFYDLKGLYIALFEEDKLIKCTNTNIVKKGFKGFTISHNVSKKEDVDNIVKSLKEKGIEIVKGPYKTSWGGYCCYITDPDNNVWEIIYNPFLIIA